MKHLWNRHPGLPGDAGRWGVVKPTLLNSIRIIPEDLEVIAQRYRETYPGQEFVVSEGKPS